VEGRQTVDAHRRQGWSRVCWTAIYFSWSRWRPRFSDCEPGVTAGGRPVKEPGCGREVNRRPAVAVNCGSPAVNRSLRALSPESAETAHFGAARPAGTTGHRLANTLSARACRPVTSDFFLRDWGLGEARDAAKQKAHLAVGLGISWLGSRPTSRTARLDRAPSSLRHGLPEYKRENARENAGLGTSTTGHPRVEVRG